VVVVERRKKRREEREKERSCGDVGAIEGDWIKGKRIEKNRGLGFRVRGLGLGDRRFSYATVTPASVWA